MKLTTQLTIDFFDGGLVGLSVHLECLVGIDNISIVEGEILHQRIAGFGVMCFSIVWSVRVESSGSHGDMGWRTSGGDSKSRGHNKGMRRRCHEQHHARTQCRYQAPPTFEHEHHHNGDNAARANGSFCIVWIVSRGHEVDGYF